MTHDLLTVEQLEAGYGRMRVLHGVSLGAAAGQCACIIGPNGAGKSTVLRAIFGQVRIYGGAVRLDGEPVTGLPPRELLRRGIAYVPQGRVVFPSLTVQENLLVAARSAGLACGPADLERVLEHFPALRDRLHQRAGGLSGGQQQMVALGRALVARPRLLLMDEPSLGLAPMLVAGIFQKVAELCEGGTAVLLVEQNARKALSVADRAYVLELGRNRYEGTGAQLLDDPRVQELYLGGHVHTEPADTSEGGQET